MFHRPFDTSVVRHTLRPHINIICPHPLPLAVIGGAPLLPCPPFWMTHHGPLTPLWVTHQGPPSLFGKGDSSRSPLLPGKGDLSRPPSPCLPLSLVLSKCFILIG